MSQSVIIGGSTTVTFESGDCVLSAQWGYNPGKQDAYCLGYWLPSDKYTIYKPTETLSITLYGPGTPHPVDPTESCSDASVIKGSVTPKGCGDAIGGVSGSWHVTGYNYSKESVATPGQESWAMTKWKGVTGPENSVFPTWVLRGITQGQTDGSTGIVIEGTSVDASAGSVSAGGIGKGNVMTHGTVTSVGGGDGPGNTLGTGSATIPYTPLYIG